MSKLQNQPNPDRNDAPPLSSPGVSFAPDYAARVERCAARMRARLARREEFGGGSSASHGHDFVGYRPYHAGDDPRAIDWAAYARSDRPLVRLTRREAGEHWAIVIDASASMGLGTPGKLQLAAETAGALALVARRCGARASVSTASLDPSRGRRDATDEMAPFDRTGPIVFEFDARARVADLLAFLSGIEASGRCDGADVRRALAEERRAARVFVLSDCLSSRPSDVTALRARHDSVTVVRILAPHELGAAEDGGVEWVDPESGARVKVDVDARLRGRYEAELSAELEAWRLSCGRAGVRHDVHSSRAEFEDVAARALERAP